MAVMIILTTLNDILSEEWQNISAYMSRYHELG